MPKGYALEEATTTQVVAAYAAASIAVPAHYDYAVPAWYLAGEFFLPLGVERARLDVIGLVSDPILTLEARLYDTTAVAEVVGSIVSLTRAVPSRVLSAGVKLAGGRQYQIHVRCFGGNGPDQFGSLLTATITD